MLKPNSVKDLLVIILSKLIKIVLFIFEIIRYPISNISIWIVGGLSYLISTNVVIETKGRDMFLMSAGLVSIIIFISNFLEKQTVDIDDKNNFYLGYNIKKLKFHDNFWLKRFNDLPVSLLFWIIAGFPIIVVCSELNFSSKQAKHIFNSLNKYIEYFKIVWVATFIVILIYSVALLIESVALSSKNFSRSNLYQTTNLYEKGKIKTKIRNYFKILFDDIFNFRLLIGVDDEYRFKIENSINYIINTGSEVSSNEDELNEFYTAAFECEAEKIDKIQKKLKKYVEIAKDEQKNHTITRLLLKRNFELLQTYYNLKWYTLSRLSVVPAELVKIAIIEKQYGHNKEYKDEFWGSFNENKLGVYEKGKEKIATNLCISKIQEIIREKFRDDHFIDELKETEIDQMVKLFDILNKIDRLFSDSYGIDNGKIYNRHFSSIFEIVFKLTINDKKKDNQFVKLFSNKMKSNYLPEYVIKERINLSKKILLSGDLIPNDILEYLLQFMDLEDIIIVLIIRLAYLDRSELRVMTIDEFKIWDRKIYECKKGNGSNILDSKEFKDKLCKEISTSNVSHFLSEEFVQWMFSSLCKEFDKENYKKFIELGEKSVRKNFSLNRYIIVRLLLSEKSYNQSMPYLFNDSERKQMKKKLDNIEDILQFKDIYI